MAHLALTLENEIMAGRYESTLRVSGRARASRRASAAAMFVAAGLWLATHNTARQARADYLPPDQVVVKTEPYTPAHVDFSLGTYEYSVNWQGIPVGTAAIAVTNSTVEQPGSRPERCLTVSARAKSAGLVSVFYSLRHLSESTFRADTMTPLNFFSVQTENSKTKSREVAFSRDGFIRSILWKQGKETPDEEIAFRSGNQTFDPISAAFLARSLPVREGEALTFDVFNGKHRFLITLRVEGRETIRVAGGKREAFRVVPSVKKLTDTEGENRLRSATLWIAADPSREVLKLKSQVLIGSVNAELVRFIPETKHLPSGTARAALQSLPTGDESVEESADSPGK